MGIILRVFVIFYLLEIFFFLILEAFFMASCISEREGDSLWAFSSSNYVFQSNYLEDMVFHYLIFINKDFLV